MEPPLQMLINPFASAAGMVVNCTAIDWHGLLQIRLAFQPLLKSLLSDLKRMVSEPDLFNAVALKDSGTPALLVRVVNNFEEVEVPSYTNIVSPIAMSSVSNSSCTAWPAAESVLKVTE